MPFLNPATQTSADEGETAPFRVRLVVTRCVATGGAGQVTSDPSRFSVTEPPGIDYRKVPLPGPQPSMGSALTAPAVPAVDLMPNVDLATIVVPPA